MASARAQGNGHLRARAGSFHQGTNAVGFGSGAKKGRRQSLASVVRRSVTVVNKLGLHARAAAKFVTLASRFESEIRLLKDGRQVNGKSIMGVMMLAAARGSTLEIEADGADAPEALNQLEQLIRERFGEPQ